MDAASCFPVVVSGRITVDLGDERLVRGLELEAIRENTSVKEVVARAVRAYLSSRHEDFGLLGLAERAFAEWENPEDAEYDRL
jgi:hypothetical protein